MIAITSWIQVLLSLPVPCTSAHLASLHISQSARKLEMLRLQRDTYLDTPTLLLQLLPNEEHHTYFARYNKQQGTFGIHSEQQFSHSCQIL